jgi:type II secretory ATPase GspE/PulE/Tfp pilus assembly ATPase PilB-like protein
MPGSRDQDVPQFVDAVLTAALTAGASDIYWLPGRRHLAIRFRVDGVQVDHVEVDMEMGRQCLTHVKVLAKLLTYRTQVAQDGVIRRQLADGSEAELRVATMPTQHGERITVRLAQKRTAPLLLDELRFAPACVAAVRQLLARPHGLCILTGPTGCGKTTTIYAMIRELLRQNEDPASIISLEDPIEASIDGITQTDVGRADGEWDYEAGLRAALRQDVKTLVVGEMRDRGVVQVVLDAALSGHRVITTYHAGDIPSVYARILHQGFEPFLVAAAVTGVVTQRLVCEDGRTVPVAAVLEADDQWREFVCSRPDIAQIRRRAAAYPLADLGRAAGTLAASTHISTGAAARIAS